MKILSMGERAAINSQAITVYVDAGNSHLNLLLLGLSPQGSIADDRYSVLESNMRSPQGEISLDHQDKTYRYSINLAQLPPAIDALVVTAYHEQPVKEHLPLVLTVEEEGISFNAGPHLGGETAITIAKIYRHQGGWRISAVAQGYSLGIERLIQSLGGTAT